MTHGQPTLQPANPTANLPAWARPFHTLARNPWFVYVITLVIVIASVLAGMQTYDAVHTRYGDLLNAIDKIIIGIFVIEILIRIAAYGHRPWRFFLDGWNLFDFIIVVACLWPADDGGTQYATVFRLVRLLRALRLISAIPRLQVMIVALIKALPSIFYVGVLLLLLFYIYAVTGTVVFGRNDPIHFGTLDIAMLSLFRVVTLEDWTDVMYWQIYGTHVYSYATQRDMLTPAQLETYKPQAFGLFGALYFVSFVMVGTMIALNLFVAVVLGGMSAAEKEQAAKLVAQRPGGQDFPARLESIETQLAGLLSDLGEVRRTMSSTTKNGDK